jgi:hypothetical protein
MLYQSARAGKAPPVLALTVTQQVPKRPFFILVPALVMALVRYFVIVLVDLLAQNDHLEQIVVRIETIDLSKALASLVFVE